jgi:hypothetical protein
LGWRAFCEIRASSRAPQLSGCLLLRRREHPAGVRVTSAVPAPPIEAIDEPAPDDVEDLWSTSPSEVAVGTHFFCIDGEPYETNENEPCEPSPEEIEKLRNIGEQFEQAIRSARGSEPRKIARLRLTERGPRSQAFLIAWRNRADKLCLTDSEEDEEGGSSGGAFGPCMPEGRCGAICLTGSGAGSGQESLYSTSGVVASKADALLITFDDGQVVTYELNGPFVPGYPGYRVFMLDLGRRIETHLELLHEGRVIAEEKRSRAEVRAMRCSERAPLSPPEDEQERETAWMACMTEEDSE